MIAFTEGGITEMSIIEYIKQIKYKRNYFTLIILIITLYGTLHYKALSSEIAKYDLSGRPNLCLSERVLIVKSLSMESRYTDGNYGYKIYTKHNLIIERVIFGSDVEKSIITFDWPGGTVDNVTSGTSHFPVIFSDNYYLFLIKNEVYNNTKIIGHYKISQDITLPSSQILNKNWISFCNSHPEGIFYLKTPSNIIIDFIMSQR